MLIIPQGEGFIILEGTLFEYRSGTILWVQPYGTKKLRRYKDKLIRRYYEKSFINHISINFR